MERYLVTGVQLGILIGTESQVERERLVKDIVDIQYINDKSNTVLGSCIKINELLVKVRVMVRIRKIYLELLEKNKQLQVFNKASVDRELKMMELKEKIRGLEEEITRYKR